MIKIMQLRHSVLLLLLVVLAFGCKETPEKAVEELPHLFTLLKGEETGLDFNNKPELSAEFNVFNYMYFYNGGGLAAGDFNEDGLVDLYFTANMDTNRMYLNEGNMKFREITDEAGVAGLPGWTTGASVVDINQDGLLDIYVNQVSGYLMLKGANQLYVCQGIENGIPVYKDEAAAYGLDFIGFGTQAAFFDYDLDGDLDVYQLNHSLHQNGTFGKREGKIDETNALAGDKLLRNDEGRYTDVSKEAGIYSSVIGYGLGLATGDLNNDGWPDIYIGNDFHENDYLYLNNQDGTFREVLTEQMQHTSRFSMGVDIADINNDGNREIFSLDMLPEDPQILKSSLGEDGYDIFKFKLGFGYNPQFSRNTLQLNNGDGSFSEIGAFAGVEASDWSWAPLFFDMNHDGRRDLFISNGIPRRMNDIDYINFKTNSDLKFREEFNEIRDYELGFIDKMPEIKLKNKVYLNTGDLRFQDLSEGVVNGAVSYSGSSVYADLDNDGDLDVVANNIDDKPYIYRNDLLPGPGNAKEEGEVAGAWLSIRVQGPEGNRDGIGSMAIAFAGTDRMVYEYYPVRGYQSSVQAPLHMGIGDPALVDSILFIWPDRRCQSLSRKALNRSVVVSYDDGLPVLPTGFAATSLNSAPATAPTREDLFSFLDITEAAGIDHVHKENVFVDFTREPLMPHMASTEGPALAVGDVNGDGLDDFFIGSSKRERSALYLQTANDEFVRSTPAAIVADSVFEDVDAALTDLDGDGDLDLVVAAGGNEYFAKQEPRLQRTYLNDGTGNFTREKLWPDLYMTASCVLPADVNGDGYTDLFFGGRVVPRFYGQTPGSYLLINDGTGQFRDATEEWSPDLKKAGMVKDGKWADIDGDGDIDLVLAIEWEPITLYRNEGGSFKKEPINDLKGWWNTLEVADLNEDGHPDILAGNLGLNNKLKPSLDEPIEMYLNDFDDNEQPEQILTYYVKGERIPFAGHAELIKQLPGLKKRYLFAQDMAGASLEEIFTAGKLAGARKYTVNTLASYSFINDGNGGFYPQPLPDRAQFSSINAFQRSSEEQNGSQWLLGGNFLSSNIEMGWYDAGFLGGLDFTIDITGVTCPVSGLKIGGVIRDIETIRMGDGTAFLIGRNDSSLRLISRKPAD